MTLESCWPRNRQTDGTDGKGTDSDSRVGPKGSRLVFRTLGIHVWEIANSVVLLASPNQRPQEPKPFPLRRIPKAYPFFGHPANRHPAPNKQLHHKTIRMERMEPTQSRATKRRRSFRGRRGRLCRSACAVTIAIATLASTTTTTTTSSMTASALWIPDPVVHFGVGAVAGGAGAVAAYPLDYVKSTMQTEEGKERYGNGWGVFRETLKSHGPLRLYKGVGVQVLGIAPEKGIKLGVNDVLAVWCVASLGGFPLWAQVASGGVAGACQVIASSPLEVLKVGLQTSDKSLPQVWEGVGGLQGLFRGAGACVVRDVLFTAVCFPLYAYWAQELGWSPFVAGAASGVVASFVATPPDVVKTRILSTDPVAIAALPRAAATGATARVAPDGAVVLAAAAASPPPATNATASWMAAAYAGPQPQPASSDPWRVLGTILEEEGPLVLLSGVSERCLGAVPRFGTTLAVHDLLEHAAHQAGWLSQTGLA